MSTARISLPSMKVRNVQTNNVFTLTDREQIGKCLKQTFNSQVATQTYIDGKIKDDFIIRPVPRFEIVDCDKELSDLIPREDATKTIREKLIGKGAEEMETLQSLKAFCYEKGIHHHPSISFEKLKMKVDRYKELSAKAE